jgi:signal transduction histidine kinase
MKSVVQMLIEEDGSDPEQLRLLRRLENEVDRLSSFLRTFHGFSAPQQTNPIPVALDAALEDVLLWTRKEARARGVSIAFTPCHEPLPQLWADSSQLKQVLLNLVINAIQATPEGGKVEIGMCFGEGHPEDLEGLVPRLRFCISDTGHGIAPDVLPKIFDPFFTTRAKGSGLGLAVVKKIAVQHGADILVTSKLGSGTRFELVWPVAMPAEAVDAIPRIACANGDCRRLVAHA